MNQLIKIFCEIDDYCKEYELSCRKFLVNDDLKSIMPRSSMALSEIMTIVVYFHQSRFRDFKSYFPKSVSYNRFVELMRYSLIPLLLYTIQYGFGKCDGLNFIDSMYVLQ